MVNGIYVSSKPTVQSILLFSKQIPLDENVVDVVCSLSLCNPLHAYCILFGI